MTRCQVRQLTNTLMILTVFSLLIGSTLANAGTEEVTTIRLTPAGLSTAGQEAATVEEHASNGGDSFKPDDYRLSNDRKLIGWKVSEALYFGRTRINRKNNVGLVFDRDDTTFSVGHKGLFYSFRF